MLALTLLILLALFVLIALPGLAAITQPRAGLVAAPCYLAILAAIFLHYLGFTAGGEIPVVARPVGEVPALCTRAIEQAQGGGLILDRSNPARVIVARALWAELPQQARQGLVLCLEMARPSDLQQVPVEIVEQGGQ